MFQGLVEIQLVKLVSRRISCEVTKNDFLEVRACLQGERVTLVLGLPWQAG